MKSLALLVVGLSLPGCLFGSEAVPDARDYQDPYADADPYPGFRDAGCGPGYSGDDCWDGGPTLPEDIDASPPDADLPDAAPPCDQHTFEYLNSDATSVWVTGSFTSWAAEPPGALELVEVADGTWKLTTIVGAGRHLYKFVIDGSTWIADPVNPETEPDGYGGQNSVIELCM